MLTLPRRDRRHCLAVTLVTLMLLLIPSGSPLRADSGTERTPFCREDGVCLPAPRLASELAAELRPEASQASEPGIPCEAPLLVKRLADVDPRAFQRQLERRGYARVEGLLTPQWWRVCLPETAVSAKSAELAALMALPEVEIAEPDGIAYAALTPNDPYYGVQWALPKIGAPAAWETTMGSTDVMIAVIDSGMDYYHPDSPEHLWLGWDYAYGDDDPYDDCGHGTHVMGIAAARTSNGVGVAALCPGCSVLSVKVLSPNYLGQCTGNWSDVADGITYAVDASGPLADKLVINLSLGGSATSSEKSIVVDAIDYARAQDAIIVAAAGNYGPAEPMFPASLPGVIAISATDSADRPASMKSPDVPFSSQYGDLGAPGVFVFSTMPLWVSSIGPYGEPPYYRYMSGTSMATPLVASAASLVWSIHPEYSAFQVKLALLKNVDVPGDWDLLYGVGRLNVERAVTAPEIVLQHVYLPLTVR